MPTRRWGRVKRLLKEGKARIVGKNPFTIQLLYETPTYTQPLTLGIDPGSEGIGVAVRKENGEVVFAAELRTRTREVTENMEERKGHRRERRRNQRDKRKRRASHTSWTCSSPPRTTTRRWPPAICYLILVTDYDPHPALADYACRWEIESLFECLKSRGFRFEETHLTKPERIQKLIAVLAIAFSWAHLMGEWLHQQKPIKIKKHGRKMHSFFRYGLDHLRKIILNFSEHLREFVWAVRLLGIALTSPSLLSYRNTG